MSSGAGREGAADENEERADQQDTGGEAKPLHASTPSKRPEALVSVLDAMETNSTILGRGSSMHGKCQAKTVRYVNF